MNIDSVSEILKAADLGIKTWGELEDLAEVAKLPNMALPAGYVVAETEMLSICAVGARGET